MSSQLRLQLYNYLFNIGRLSSIARKGKASTVLMKLSAQYQMPWLCKHLKTKPILATNKKLSNKTGKVKYYFVFNMLKAPQSFPEVHCLHFLSSCSLQFCRTPSDSKQVFNVAFAQSQIYFTAHDLCNAVTGFYYTSCFSGSFCFCVCRCLGSSSSQTQNLLQ